MEREQLKQEFLSKFSELIDSQLPLMQFSDKKYEEHYKDIVGYIDEQIEIATSVLIDTKKDKLTIQSAINEGYLMALKNVKDELKDWSI